MMRALSILNVALLVLLGVLWTFDATLESGRESERASDSKFHALSGPDALAVTDVKRLDLSLPGSGVKWTYTRRDDGWHLPQYRDGFGLGQEIEGFLKAILDGRGTVVGRVPGDAEHFGISPGRTIEAEIHDGAGSLRLHAIAGSVAPGQRASECYLTARGRDTILHMNSNPRPYVESAGDGRFPPLLDTRVIPLALSRGLPARISFTGEAAPPVGELMRREIPRERLMAMGGDRGPRFEWFGTTAEGEKRVNDTAAFTYTGFLSRLAFDELVGPRTGREAGLEKPSLLVTLEYDGGTKDTLVLGPREE
ncbi:MAG TPA: hypothetical protein VMT52_07660, partial [Planctomycetota bacterium]|nr:hypothetical protein [Planctomycetota bacterium]